MLQLSSSSTRTVLAGHKAGQSPTPGIGDREKDRFDRLVTAHASAAGQSPSIMYPIANHGKSAASMGTEKPTLTRSIITIVLNPLISGFS